MLRPANAAFSKAELEFWHPSRHLERVLRIYTAHYNRERPHRGLALLSPDSTNADPLPSGGEITRCDRLGGLIHEYHRAQHEPTFETPQEV